MNLRSIVLSGVLLLTVAVTFGFKSAKRDLGPVSIFAGGICTNFAANTNEPVCTATGTGPQCTVTGARYLAYKFEPTSTPTCSVPLRTPF